MASQPSEEQMKALQEKIKNMSPEELKEFQKKQCIFCQIIAGKVQSKKIYEDETTFAILDINPANPGHILLMTKEHYTIMPQVPESELKHIFMVSKALSNALLRGIGAQGTNILVANGVAAGQRAQHFMIHIIPRMENDNLNFDVPQKNIPENQLEEIREKISTSLDYNITQETEKEEINQEEERSAEEEEDFQEEENKNASLEEELGLTDEESGEYEKDDDDSQEEEEGNEEEPEEEDDSDFEDSQQESDLEEDEEKKEDESEVDLDDIANLLGGKS